MKWEYFLVVGLLVFGSFAKKPQHGRAPASVENYSAMVEMSQSAGL